MERFNSFVSRELKYIRWPRCQPARAKIGSWTRRAMCASWNPWLSVRKTGSHRNTIVRLGMLNSCTGFINESGLGKSVFIVRERGRYSLLTYFRFIIWDFIYFSAVWIGGITDFFLHTHRNRSSNNTYTYLTLHCLNYDNDYFSKICSLMRTVC